VSGARPEHPGTTRRRRPLGLTRGARSLAAVSTVLIVGTVVAACGSSPKASAPPSTSGPPPSTTQPTPTTLNYRHSAYAPPGTLWPKGIFSKPDVANWPLVSASSKFASDIVADYTQDYGSVGVNSMPIYRVPADQPDVPVSVLSGCNSFLPDTGDQIPIPPYVTLNGSSDNPLVIYQPSTKTDWELWRTTKTASGTYSACWGGKLDMASSSGVFPSPFGLSATGISYLATAITEDDVASGHIDHAIAIQIPRCNEYVYPADRHDCGSDPGQPAEGQWFRLPASLSMPAGLTPFAQMVFTALQRYGAVVTDFAGAVMLQAEEPSDWAQEGNSGIDPMTASWDGLPEYKVVASLPWSSLQAVAPPQG
jgi:hypothetical protein